MNHSALATSQTAIVPVGGFNVPLDTLQVISEMIFPVNHLSEKNSVFPTNHLAGTGKQNLTATKLNSQQRKVNKYASCESGLA